MKASANYSELTGVQKAAAFLLTLSEEQIGKVFAHLDEDEIKEISLTMAQLGKVENTVMDKLYDDVREQMQSSGALVGSFDNTERLLQKLLPKDRAESIMEEIRGPAGRTMWDKLGNVSKELLATYLKNEYPQTIAVILSKIRTEHAANVLAILPDNLAMEVVLRMLRMEPVQKEIIEDIERTLRTEFMNNISRSNKRNPHELVAEIFNFFDRSTEAKFMGSLEERNPESSEKVKALMFTFDDIAGINDAGIQAIMRVADKSKLALALKGANDNIKDLFFKNMSERAGKIMKEDMESLGPVKVKNVEESQNHVVMVAKGLGDKGEIVLRPSSDSDEEMIG